jgi:hypothetical protein
VRQHRWWHLWWQRRQGIDRGATRRFLASTPGVIADRAIDLGAVQGQKTLQ